jgi:hypothetical protein
LRGAISVTTSPGPLAAPSSGSTFVRVPALERRDDDGDKTSDPYPGGATGGGPDWVHGPALVARCYRTVRLTCRSRTPLGGGAPGDRHVSDSPTLSNPAPTPPSRARCPSGSGAFDHAQETARCPQPPTRTDAQSLVLTREMPCPISQQCASSRALASCALQTQVRPPSGVLPHLGEQSVLTGGTD